ncbi:MAG: AAA family ATPase [Bacteroidales bacterium]|nr:AAA family ATPase [Bacteroidales bacterium]
MKIERIIIGITGTLGAGKGTIVDYLMTQYLFRHYSVRSYLSAEAQRRNLPLNRDTYVLLANELRANNSPSFIIDELYKEAKQGGANAIIESIRTPGEVASLRKNSEFSLWAIDAAPEIRYRRIISRNSETDHVSFETFIANEQREMVSANPNRQNLSKCMEQADFRLNNNGDFQELYRQIDTIIAGINSHMQ